MIFEILRMNNLPIATGLVWDGKGRRIMCHLVQKMKKFQEDCELLLGLAENRKFFQSPNANFSLTIKWYRVYRRIFGDFSFKPLNHPDYGKESLEKLALSELCDLLVKNTITLLESMERKADGITLRDQKKNVELLQEIIRQKRAVATNGSDNL